MPKNIKNTETLNHIKDVDIVRWAHVRALLLHGRSAEEAHNNAILDKLLSAPPKTLKDMLGINLALAQRVRKVLLENEQSRR